MSPQLAEALEIHQARRKDKGLALGIGDLPEYVLTNEKGKPIDTDNWRRRVFDKALQRARLGKIRIHDLRHTYATLRIPKGDNIGDVSRQLGHSSISDDGYLLSLDTGEEKG
jgi:integrase